MIRRSTRLTVGVPLIVRTRPPWLPLSVALGLPSSVSDFAIVNRPTHVPLIRSVEPGGAALIRFWRFCVAQLTFTIAACVGATTASAPNARARRKIVRTATILAGSKRLA
jgi:hypothetical protein